MKISARKKAENRQAILAAAVDLIIENGVRSTSMRAVARQAGVGDATIYNYFPTKEALIQGYYIEAFSQAVDSLHSVEDFEQCNLNERLQILFEAILECFLADREFVNLTFASVFFDPIPAGKSVRAMRNQFMGVVKEQFQAAEESGELTEMMFRELVCHFVWDFFVAVVLYWLRDDSEQFSNTTVFIDRSMDLGYSVIRSGVLDKITGLASFLFKSHILSRVDMFDEHKATFRKLKQEFMDNVEPR